MLRDSRLKIHFTENARHNKIKKTVNYYMKAYMMGFVVKFIKGYASPCSKIILSLLFDTFVNASSIH